MKLSKDVIESYRYAKQALRLFGQLKDTKEKLEMLQCAVAFSTKALREFRRLMKQEVSS